MDRRDGPRDLLTAMMAGKTDQRTGKQWFACPCGTRVLRPANNAVGTCGGCGRRWDFGS